MKITELMIGNWIDTPHGFDTITNIDGKNFLLETTKSNGLISLAEVKPIPITVEMLPTLNYSKWKDTDQLYTEGNCELELLPRNGGAWELYSFDESNGGRWFLKQLKYVHELHNMHTLLEVYFKVDSL